MRTVRVTMTPGKDIEVDDAEYNNLKSQGLIVPGSDGEPVTVSESAPPSQDVAGPGPSD